MAAQTAAPPRSRAPSLPRMFRREQLGATQDMVRARASAGRALAGRRAREVALRLYDWINGIWNVAQREGFPRLLLIMMLLWMAISASVYFIERKTFVPSAGSDAPQIGSLGDALWWSIVTMTTTGYGDMVPKTPYGRLVAGGLMVSGALLLSLFTASFASLLVAQRLEADRGLSVLKVKNHIIIIGWNEFADQVVAGLVAAVARRPQFVLINQLSDEQLTEIRFRYRTLELHNIRGNPTHETVLARANLELAVAVIILADTSVSDPSRADDKTLFTALAIRDSDKQVRIAAQLMDSDKESAIRHAGVDEIVVAGQDTSFFLASGAIAPGLGRAARLLLTHGSGREIKRIELARELRGRTFGEARRYYRESGELLIGIISEGAVVTIGDVLGSSTDWVDEFIRSAFQMRGQEVVAQDQDRTQAIMPPPDDYVVGNKDSGILIGGEAITAVT